MMNATKKEPRGVDSLLTVWGYLYRAYDRGTGWVGTPTASFDSALLELTEHVESVGEENG